jgi:glycosyltransferase involved in cell wall biosynthesis
MALGLMSLRPKDVNAKTTSRVAVLMPAYNAGQSINRAVDSVVQGTVPCDIYVVDDGSDVPVAVVLKPFPRTSIIRLESNGGIPRARNAGLQAILSRSYEYVACLDADDICHPDRIASQVDFLDRHPAVAVVGTWGRSFDASSGEPLRIGRMPVTPNAVRRAMRFNSAVINTSAMLRTSVLRAIGIYSERYPAAEDYELYRRIGQRFDIANIPSILTTISISSQGVSRARRRRQLADRLAIQLKYFEALQIGAWLGVAKTLALFLAPVSMLSRVKTIMRRATRAEPVSGDGPPLAGRGSAPERSVVGS